MFSRTASAYSAIVAALFLSFKTSAQQPYRDWDAAYEAAEELISSWSIQELANVTVRNGVAPGYLPFTVTDGKSYHKPA